DCDDGADIEEAGDQLLGLGVDVPSAFDLGVFVAEDLEKPDHGLEARDGGRVWPLLAPRRSSPENSPLTKSILTVGHAHHAAYNEIFPVVEEAVVPPFADHLDGCRWSPWSGPENLQDLQDMHADEDLLTDYK